MKTIVLTGATGLIGKAFVDLFAIPRHAHLRIVARTKPNYEIPADAEVVIVKNFHDKDEIRSALKEADEMVCCIGTTIKKAGSKQAFESTDVGIVQMLSEVAAEFSYTGFHYVSSIDANAQSSNFYLQCKGRAEQAVLEKKFVKTTMLRPSMLLGPRQEFRLGELIGKFLMKALPFVFFGPLKRYRSIQAETVAKTLLYRAMSDNEDHLVLESEDIKEYVRLKINF